MSTVQVLCPNGRRQNVKITPNTKLLQILEEVCQKQSLLPAEDYKLVHGVARTSLDLTLSVQFANLPNNAKLELVKLDKSRSESEVLIALQLPSGQRLQHRFKPATSLWEVLQHFEDQPDSPYKGELSQVDESQMPALHPVCVYMREEVIGQLALKETKLRSLGLTGGKAALRLFHRPVDEGRLAAIKKDIEKEKQRRACLEQKPSTNSSSHSGMSQTTLEASFQTHVTSVEPGPSHVTQVSTETGTICLNINVNIQSDTQPAACGKLLSEERGEPANKMVKTESSQDREPDNIMVKMGSSHDSSDTVEPMEIEPTGGTDPVVMETETTPVGAHAEYGQSQREAAQALRDMNIPGLEIFTPDDFADLTPEEQRIAQRLAARFIEQPGSTPKSDTVQETVSSSQPSFLHFKFPEETKGENLLNNELSLVKKKILTPCQREPIVFSLEENWQGEATQDAVPNSTDLPDDFFEVTEKDIRILLASQKKVLRELDDQPLMTSAMRQARLEETYSRYEKVTIRVHFQDKLVLQGLFRPQETVFDVKKFVKEHLVDSDLPFYLYTSPPKMVLKDNGKTLIQAKLVPATVVYFGCDTHKDHYLQEASLSNIRSRMEADYAYAQCLNTFTTDEKEEPIKEEPSQMTKQAGASQPHLKSSSRSSLASVSTERESNKSVPKWFKVGKK